MARIEDLVDEVADADLRRQIAREIKQLKSTKRFGLVYEEQVPETVSLFGLQIRPGAVVQDRTKPNEETRWQIISVSGAIAIVQEVGTDGPTIELAVENLLTVKHFEEPIYPGLVQLDELRLAVDDRPSHLVLSAENFHALELLTYTHASRVNLIYIDPPYNTGERAWKYNNRFVDANDSYRHSKWLAMMEKRLRLAKTLLNPEGSTLICAIDEKEFLRLGLLLEEIFPESTVQMVSTVVKPEGTNRVNEFSRTNEFVFFVMQPGSSITPGTDNMFDRDGSEGAGEVEWRNLRRREKTSKRGSRPNQFYSVFVDEETGRIHSIGDPLDDDTPRDSVACPEGTRAVFPLTPKGAEMIWGVVPKALRELVKKGFARSHDDTIQYLTSGTVNAILTGEADIRGRDEQGAVVAFHKLDSKTLMPKTVWVRDAHNTQVGGTLLLKKFLPEADFPSPKSVYAVVDAMSFFVRHNPNAIILDFFAGSGTTLHATAVLNAQDGGRRQCLLITNNDVSDEDAKVLHEDGSFGGDRDFEAHGIFEAVTRPRTKAVLTGKTPKGARVEGSYPDNYLADHEMSEGFEENVAFFRMEYLEPDLVELGRQYEAIAPLLWMAAGSVGNWESWDGKAAWSAPTNSTYAVLFNMATVAGFASHVESSAGRISHVWIVTDSHSAFLDAQKELPSSVKASQLYRDYLRNFVVNVSGETR